MCKGYAYIRHKSFCLSTLKCYVKNLYRHWVFYGHFNLIYFILFVGTVTLPFNCTVLCIALSLTNKRIHTLKLADVSKRHAVMKENSMR